MPDTPTHPVTLEEIDRLRAAWETGGGYYGTVCDDLAAMSTELKALRVERERLREALVTARTELDKWGYGDFHYGPTPREPSVLDAIAAIDAVIEPGPPQEAGV